MVEVYSKALDKYLRTGRIIGEYKGDSPGPITIFMGGMHGNEPAGVFALAHVLDRLKDISPPFKGTMYAIAGNLDALNKGERYISVDLNRVWNKSDIKKHIFDNNDEASQRNEIIRTIFEIISGSEERPFLFDLHTTSSESIPFLGISDTLRSRDLVNGIHSPIILGLEERMAGTLFNSLNEIGLTSVIFEGGQHDSLSSIENHVSVVFEFLKNTGCINPGDIPGFHKYNHRLSKTSSGDRKTYEITYVYRIKKNEKFKMKPGFVNFEGIEKGEELATNKKGNITSPETGLIFMPLYQKLGDEGFFIIKRIHNFWLKVSEFMRKLHAEKVFRLLPGIKKNPEENSSYIINTKIARFMVMNIFHLFGYRREKKEGNTIIVSRREYDSKSPSPEELRDNYKKFFGLN